jgi:nucleotide-binding universal stress UspA family protein
MLTITKILVPIDFSDRSLKALSYAVGIAQNFNSKLMVVYVNEPVPPISDKAWGVVDRSKMYEEHLGEAKARLKAIVEERTPKEMSVGVEILTGDPAPEIITVANDFHADLIVMGTHGRGGLAHLLMGSTAEKLLRKAPCPVLTLREPMPVSV